MNELLKRDWRTAFRGLFIFCLLFFLFSSSFAQSPQAVAHFNEARGAETRADWQLAESQYKQALALAPRWAEAQVNLGVVLNRQGKTDEAIIAGAVSTRKNLFRPGAS